ncbi:MAG TPA: DUF4129 domain-containing protein [Acidisarcina sp.]
MLILGLLMVSWTRIEASAAPISGVPSYPDHLTALIALVDRCSQATDPTHCDTRQVGQDDTIHIQTPHGQIERQAHYDWLRDTLTSAVTAKKAEMAKAATKAAATNKPANPPPATPAATPAKPSANPGTPLPTDDDDDEVIDDDSKPNTITSQSLLADARAHLIEDQQALQLATQASTLPPDHQKQHKQIESILAEQEFDQIEHPSAWDRAVEAFQNWINNLFSRLPSRAGSKWVLLIFEWGLVIAAATGLAWWLIQGSRREHWRLESANGPRAGAPSLRDWKVWVADAEALAAAGQWREAVHMIYWAAISRLESRGIWPVDRARTPREYLALIAASDPRRNDLTLLTRGFERIWYGYRAAAEPEYRSARQLLEKLAAQ